MADKPKVIKSIETKAGVTKGAVGKAANSKSPVRPVVKPSVSQAESTGKATMAASPKKPLMALVSVPSGASPSRSIADLKPAAPPSIGGALANKAAKGANDTLKMKDLIEKVAASTGAKRPQIREILEAGLAAMGNALSSGVMLNLPPFGKAKVSRAAEVGSGKPMTIKLHRSPTGGPKSIVGTAAHTLADDED